jgi:hypothetical protein
MRCVVRSEYLGLTLGVEVLAEDMHRMHEANELMEMGKRDKAVKRQSDNSRIHPIQVSCEDVDVDVAKIIASEVSVD